MVKNDIGFAGPLIRPSKKSADTHHAGSAVRVTGTGAGAGVGFWARAARAPMRAATTATSILYFITRPLELIPKPAWATRVLRITSVEQQVKLAEKTGYDDSSYEMVTWNVRGVPSTPPARGVTVTSKTSNTDSVKPEISMTLLVEVESDVELNNPVL